MDFAADIDLLYADFGTLVTWTPKVGLPVTARAIHDRPGTTMLGGEQFATDHGLRFPISSFPSVKRGDSFTVNGVAYVAREAGQPIGSDGLEASVPLAKP